MWLVSCRRQGLLTQGPVPDLNCKLNISSFLTLSHLLDCLICTTNSVSLALLLWMMGDGIGGGGWSISGCGWDTGGGYYLMVCFFLFMLLSFVLSCPVSFFKWVEHDSYCVCFFVYYLFSLSPVPLTRSYRGVDIVRSCKTISKISIWSLFCGFPWKRESVLIWFIL